MAAEFGGYANMIGGFTDVTDTGIDEIEDEEAAKDQQQDGQQETARANIPHHVWRSGVASARSDNRADVIERAEVVGVDVAAAELAEGRATFDELLDDLEAMPPPPVVPGGLRDLVMRSLQGGFERGEETRHGP